jgi:plasmid stabilization system protein ParE
VNLEWSTAALLDLERFAEFLHERHPKLATVVASEILAKAESLVALPHLGRPIAGRDEYREIVLRVIGADYVFQYRVTPERVVILRIFHSRENRDADRR